MYFIWNLFNIIRTHLVKKINFKTYENGSSSYLPIIFCILWTQYQTAIFQGPLHFQCLRWLPPVSELNTCITILQYTKQGISFSLLHYKATLLSQWTSYPQQISPTAILVLLQIVQKICPINGLAPNFNFSVFVPGIALGAKTVNTRYFHPNPKEGWRRCH